ncbi:MAG: LPS export ABC transporter ATP-binding protein [Planctomycetes bacterium]|nr:LPS export ABC transporter ATP-binding protein [Planctomycetota bacterium]
MATLVAESLSKSYATRRVVADVALTVNAGEIVGLLGPNGAGKTTTFRCITGLVRPDSGRITFGGSDVTHTPVWKRARLGMGYLAQEPSVFRSMTVEENLIAVLEWIDSISAAARQQRALDLLERMNLVERRRQKAASLSGGEQRRLEIARVLARDPTLLLLDEPFANIDPRTVEELQSILADLRSKGLAILLTDHNVRETLSITDRAYILVDGSVFRQGSAAALVSDPAVRRAYLGERFRMEGLGGASATMPPLT